MDYIYLGKSDLLVSQLGFGGCPMGRHGWGKVDSDELTQAVLVALENGVNFFDTADVYGLGVSETILGKALKGRRQDAIIATKFGVRLDKDKNTYYDNSPEWIECSLNRSLKRLNTDFIDLFQVHYRDGKTPLTDVIEVLEAKRAEGKIRYYGLSNITPEEVCQYDLPESLISFQAEYSLANRSNEENIKEIVALKNLGFLSWGSMGQGILTGKYGIGTKFPKNDRRSRPVYVNFNGLKFKKNLRIVEALKEVSETNGKALSQIAIRWILDYLGYGIVLVGVKTARQIQQNSEAFGWYLKQREVDFLSFVSSESSVTNKLSKVYG